MPPDARDPGPIDEDLKPSSSYAMTYWIVVLASFAGAPLAVVGLGGSLIVAAYAALMAPFLGWIVDRRVLAVRAARLFNEAVRPGMESLSRGRLDDAEAVFRAALRGSRGRGGLQAIALFNIAAVRARRGDSLGAIRILYALSRYAPTKRAANIATILPLNLALHWAQVGDVVEARRWLGAARAQKTTIKLYAGNVEATILAREGRYAEAEAVLAKEWPDIERVLSAEAMRGVRARRAFALEKAGGDPKAVRRLVDAARPEDKRELVHLGAGWDEMSAFLAKNALV